MSNKNGKPGTEGRKRLREDNDDDADKMKDASSEDEATQRNEKKRRVGSSWQLKPWNWCLANHFKQLTTSQEASRYLSVNVSSNYQIIPTKSEKCVGFGKDGIVYLTSDDAHLARKFSLLQLDRQTVPDRVKQAGVDNWLYMTEEDKAEYEEIMDMKHKRSIFSMAKLNRNLSMSLFSELFGEAYVNYFVEMMLERYCPSLKPLFVPFIENKTKFVAMTDRDLSITCPAPIDVGTKGKKTTSQSGNKDQVILEKKSKFLACYSMQGMDNSQTLLKIVTELMQSSDDIKKSQIIINIVKIFRVLAIQLHACHRFGIAHNDLHPKNVNVSKHEEDQPHEFEYQEYKKIDDVRGRTFQVSFEKGQFKPITFDFSRSSITRTTWSSDALSSVVVVPNYLIPNFCEFHSTCDSGKTGTYLFTRANKKPKDQSKLEIKVNKEWARSLEKVSKSSAAKTSTDVPSDLYFYPAKDLLYLPYCVMMICDYLEKHVDYRHGTRVKEKLELLYQFAETEFSYDPKNQTPTLQALISFLSSKPEMKNPRQFNYGLFQFGKRFLLANQVKPQLYALAKKMIEPFTRVYEHPLLARERENPKKYVELFLASLPFINYVMGSEETIKLSKEKLEDVKEGQQASVFHTILSDMKTEQWDMLATIRATTLIDILDFKSSSLVQELLSIEIPDIILELSSQTAQKKKKSEKKTKVPQTPPPPQKSGGEEEEDYDIIQDDQKKSKEQKEEEVDEWQVIDRTSPSPPQNPMPPPPPRNSKPFQPTRSPYSLPGERSPYISPRVLRETENEIEALEAEIEDEKQRKERLKQQDERMKQRMDRQRADEKRRTAYARAQLQLTEDEEQRQREENEIRDRERYEQDRKDRQEREERESKARREREEDEKKKAAKSKTDSFMSNMLDSMKAAKEEAAKKIQQQKIAREEAEKKKRAEEIERQKKQRQELLKSIEADKEAKLRKQAEEVMKRYNEKGAKEAKESGKIFVPITDITSIITSLKENNQIMVEAKSLFEEYKKKQEKKKEKLELKLEDFVKIAKANQRLTEQEQKKEAEKVAKKEQKRQEKAAEKAIKKAEKKEKRAKEKADEKQRKKLEKREKREHEEREAENGSTSKKKKKEMDEEEE